MLLASFYIYVSASNKHLMISCAYLPTNPKVRMF